jgi:hypothetical protein
MRYVVLAVVVVFTSAIAVLTVQDAVRNGISVLDVVGLVIVVLFGVGIVGALLQRPRE